MEAYLTATAHFIDQTWELKSLVLETAGFAHHHTAKNISECLLDISERFGIAHVVVAVKHDEAANECAAVNEAYACKSATNKHPTRLWKSVICELIACKRA